MNALLLLALLASLVTAAPADTLYQQALADSLGHISLPHPKMYPFQIDGWRPKPRPTFGDTMMVVLAKLYEAMGTPSHADSLWLRWTTPTLGAYGCDGVEGLLLRDAQRCDVYRLAGQAPAWRVGCAASVACWDSVTSQGAPVLVRSLWAMPSSACSLKVGAGEWIVRVSGSNCWPRVVRVGN